MAVEGTGSAPRSAPLRLDDPQANATQPRVEAQANSDSASGESGSAPLDPAVTVELSGSVPPRLQPVATRDQVSLGPLGDPEKMAEAAAALAARTRDLLAAQTGSITNMSSQAILGQLPS